jgi:hypothetical protein
VADEMPVPPKSCGGRTVSVKKAKGKTKATAKIPAKKSAATKKAKDVVEVRENINKLVRASAELIAAEVIKVALTGQLATAKYLFEAVGLYPATEQTAATPAAGSLAFTLLKRMGLPTEPVIRDEDDEAVAVLTSDAKTTEITTPSVGGDPAGEHDDTSGAGAD